MKMLFSLVLSILLSLYSQVADARNTLRQMGQELEVTFSGSARSGLLTADRCGLRAIFSDDPENVVISVSPRQSSLRFGDRVLSINGLEEGSLAVRLSSISPDSKVTVVLLRNGNQISVEVQCQDVATDYKLREELVRALKRNRPSDCLDVLDKLETSSGLAAWLQDIRQICLFHANRRNSAWRTYHYPRYVYLYFNQQIREVAAVAAYSDDGVRQFEDLWPSVVTWMDDLRSRNAHALAAELRSEYTKQLESLKTTRSSGTTGDHLRSGTVSSGTCFFVRPDGLLLTNNHVIANAQAMVVTLSTGERIPATIVSTSAANDLALLEVRADGLAYLTFSDLRSAQVGMDVFTIGYPSVEILGAEAKFSSGVINSLSGLQGEPSLMQISVPLQPGNSGGPLVTDKGEVVGIVTSTAAAGAFLAATGTLPQNVNWAVKSDFAMALFDPPPKIAQTPNRQDAISRTKAAICRVEGSR